MSRTAPRQTVERLRPFESTIFAEMTELALRHDAVNLGQGFPDADGPAGMLEVARASIADGLNQYPPGRGMPVLRNAIARDRLARYGVAYDPDSEVLVTVGATEAISAAVLGLVEPGAEVVLIEPYYDSYAAAVALAGARRRVATLVREGDGFVLDHDSLRAAITPRTRMVILNSPHNPTGAVLGRSDLETIADLAREHDLLVLTDEVYEHLCFGPPGHVSLSTLPDMRERTIVVSSAAKTFNVTGWKTGWALAVPALLDGVRAAKQFMTFVAGGPFQPAVAHALTHEQNWISANRTQLRDKRDRLSNALHDVGFEVYRSDGGYFVCADIAPLGAADAGQFCRELPARIGVAAVPLGAFVDHPGRWETTVRFTFCKSDDTLDAGIERLGSLR